MIAILFATARVSADRLKVSSRIRTDPHVLPCWWYDERTDAGEFLRVPDLSSVRIHIAKGRAVTDALDARARISGVPQTGGDG
jgi:hypothetical protein